MGQVATVTKAASCRAVESCTCMPSAVWLQSRAFLFACTTSARVTLGHAVVVILELLPHSMLFNPALLLH